MINLGIRALLFSQLRNFATSSVPKDSYDARIIVDRVGYITTIGINRPEKRNCIDLKTAALLTSAIEDFENDETSRVGVLYGFGGNFCAGSDLEELANNSKNVEFAVDDSNKGLMGPTPRFIKKPLVAAINGYAVGGGLELALMCDLRVIEETAEVGIYNRRFGVPLLDGGTVRLTAILGLSKTLDLVLTGRPLSAKEAFEWGLANRIVACGTGLGQAINLASSIAKYPQTSLNADRKSVYNAAYRFAFEDLLKYERENAKKIITTESVEGAKRFISGLGKHGKSFSTIKKDIPNWEMQNC